MHTTWARKLGQWDVLLAALLVGILLIGMVTTPGYLSTFNVESAIGVMGEKALMILPLTLLIVAREIDISVASVAALSACCAGEALHAGAPLPIAVLVSISVGVGCGAVNGFCVTVLGLPSLVVTLGTLALFRGLCYVILGSSVLTDVPSSLVNFGTQPIGGSLVPQDILPFVVLAPLFGLLLHLRPMGRRIYAVGGSPETALYSAVRTAQIRFGLFIASGALCGIAGLINLGRITEATPDAMLGYELDAITIVFLGGVSFLGGSGRMSAVLLSLAVVCFLENLLQLNYVGAYGQGTAIGVLLIASLVLANAVRSINASATRRRQLKSVASRERTPAEFTTN